MVYRGTNYLATSFAKAEKALRKIFLHLKAVEFVFTFLESFLLVRHNKK